MYVIEVVPLSVLPPNVPQVLSYYHDSSLPKGAMVEVPMNNRALTAIVVGSTEIGEQKILLKKSAFQLKKISRVVTAEPQVSDFQFKIALWLAHEYVSPLGITLKHVLPPFFLKKKYPVNILNLKSLNSAASPMQPLTILCRAKEIHKAVSSHLKTGGQTLLMVPEMSYMPYFEKHFPGSMVITSKTSNKDFYAAWKAATTNDSRLFIGTRQALFLPFTNLKKIIVIDPLHEFYKSDLSPKYRAPDLARMIANFYGSQLITVSNLLGVNGYHEISKDPANFQDIQKPWPAKVEVVDLVAEQKIGYVGLLTPDVKKSMREMLKDNKKVLIFAARRGYSGIVICQNCGFTFKCPECNTPLRTHQSTEIMLLCHHDSTTQPYPHFCANCHSSNIKAVGPAGSQKIYEELRKMMDFGQIPRVPALILDTDITQNQTEEDEVMNELKKEGPAILVATQKVFSYIHDHSFDYIVIPQFDALVSSADFQTNERLWYQLEKLVDFEPEAITIQTYHKSDVLAAIARHDYESLYMDELQTRELFGYPPFSKIVKLAYRHKNLSKVRQEGRVVVEKLKMASVHLGIQPLIKISETSPLFLGKEGGEYTYTIIIKVLPGIASLREFIRFVPSSWLIDVDPRSIL